MKRLLPFLRKLAFRVCQIGGICLLSALLPVAGAAASNIAVCGPPQFFKVHTPPANVQKPKLIRDKIPDQLRIKYDQNFLKGLT
jgi:hypothetical protein